MRYNIGMANIRNFHEKLEQDLARVSAEIERRRERAPDATPREVVRESIVAVAPAPPPKPVEESVPISAALPQSDDAHLPAYLSRESPEVKAEVERLVALAFQEGIETAVAEAARRSHFLLDALHDALVDKLLPELERRGILK